MKRSVAGVGDVANIATWSGIPFHFWQAAKLAGFATEPWRVELDRVRWQRCFWNAAQTFRGAVGGFQYSPWFLSLLERQIPSELWETEVITFNQHFPRTATVQRRGGLLNHYLDAPFVALVSGRGLDLSLPKRVVERACALERENYGGSRRVVTMARWAADVARAECGVPVDKLHVILPGANVELPDGWQFPTPVGRSGKERPFTIGFLGKEWRRKGLPLLIAVQKELKRRGWKVRVLAAGVPAKELASTPGVEVVGFIDKHKDAAAFLRFLAACDVGCLFSSREALGISTLEFLRAGVPVAGFAHEGMADTLPPDAGFRVEPGTDASAIADRFEGFLKDEPMQATLRANAQRWSKLVTWERCVREFQELWQMGVVAHPVRPWRGLANQI